MWIIMFKENQMEQKTDRRIIKTKKSLKNSLIQLMASKNVQDITVKELAEKADINRKTFYNYYNSIYDIVSEIEDEIVKSLEHSLSQWDLSHDLDMATKVFQELTTIITNDMEFYGNLLRMKHNDGLTNKLIHRMKERALESIKKSLWYKERCKLSPTLDDATISIIVTYTINGMFAVYQEWFVSERKITIEELAIKVQQIVMNGFQTI